MMRNKPASSMQKTYDECYLICSTAVFFETQNNEAEALRSWKNALDQINYHNAYRVSSSYVPKTETERALFESLRQMELQCKERVDLLEALKQSRKDATKDDSEGSARPKRGKPRTRTSHQGSWLGEQTVAPAQYSDIPVATPSLPSLPSRPPVISRLSSSSVQIKPAPEPKLTSPFSNAPQLPVPIQHKSRSPSPEQNKKTMRKTLRPEGRTPKANVAQNRVSRPAPMKAAGLAWDTHPRPNSVQLGTTGSDPTIGSRLSASAARRSFDESRDTEAPPGSYTRMPDPADYIPSSYWRDTSSAQQPPLDDQMQRVYLTSPSSQVTTNRDRPTEPSGVPPPPPPHTTPFNPVTSSGVDMPRLSKPPELSYRKEYLPAVSKIAPSVASSILDRAYNQRNAEEAVKPAVARKPVATPKSARSTGLRENLNTDGDDKAVSRPKPIAGRGLSAGNITPSSEDADSAENTDSEEAQWEKRVENVMKNLPKGLDELAAKNILNEIVVKGDEVHWEDVAGLELAKKALKEAVVYPFLRPDLFMGLREPARGMLLFGPPGTGKTMLARAVATESKSTFFAISASSLTSKWHGESEKLVRALFGLAKALAPSIIFVDEIDSLLNSRGGNEHEASRRSKTEFLIQWSDLQRAAAGKDSSIGDASRVLVLAATNCPWDIDEAARRRFVRRQYIPLPEAETREIQLRTLLAAQKHDLKDRDIMKLVRLSDGYSGSDITALAKDAAMGPLRNLGEALLFTPMEKIRPIGVNDFQASLESIRPSVSKKGLEEFEEWAREYGERGG